MNEPARSKQITTGQSTSGEADQSDILELLYSSDDESGGNVDQVQTRRVGPGVPALTSRVFQHME